MPRWLREVRHLQRALTGLEAASQLGERPWRALSRQWRSAVATTRICLIPADVRRRIRTACDVGANRGDWSLGLLRLLKIERLTALEPNPDVFAVLQAQLAPFAGVTCINAAAGDTAGTVTLNVEAMSALSSIRSLSARGRLIHSVPPQPVAALSVPQVTLDDTLADYDEVSLLKIDVQGYEREVLLGAQRVLARCRCLAIEVLYEPSYYAGALRFPELVQLVEAVSPLRLSCVSEPALSFDGRGAWADAFFLHPSLP
jgi:FkbM family methyltransferase